MNVAFACSGEKKEFNMLILTLSHEWVLGKWWRLSFWALGPSHSPQGQDLGQFGNLESLEFRHHVQMGCDGTFTIIEPTAGISEVIWQGFRCCRKLSPICQQNSDAFDHRTLHGQIVWASASVSTEESNRVGIFRSEIERKHRKNCECCPGHYLIVDHYSSI